VEGEPIFVNGCTLYPTRGAARCAKGFRCDSYRSCLDVVAKRDWPGWAIEPMRS